MPDNESAREFIRQTYADIALKGAEGCGCGCSCGTPELPLDSAEISQYLGYSEEDLANAPAAANMGLGCGNPLAMAGLKEGEVVLDLGSGGGFDCFLARRRVGESGFVTGVDMTPEMIKLARSNAQKSGYANVEFRLGEIEHLPVGDASVDVIISNCVLNLSLEKEQVFREAYRVLKPGGRICVSDIVATAELPPEVKQDLAMLSGCVAGAAYLEDLRTMLESAGFHYIRLTPKDNSKQILKTWAPDKNLEEFVASFLIEAEKKAKPEMERSGVQNITIYDPAMCCSTGVCGPSPDKELVRVAAGLKRLADNGVDVQRFNLSQQPEAFVQQAEVRKLLQEKGPQVLPITLIDGIVRFTGRYPTAGELAADGLLSANFAAQNSEPCCPAQDSKPQEGSKCC